MPNDNPSIESYPVSYVDDPHKISRNDNFVSVNSTIEKDLYMLRAVLNGSADEVVELANTCFRQARRARSACSR
nr:acetyl-CoA hydrolase/transferase C-terminal domain-containing protein [Caballeronia sp. dw_19]